MGKSLILLLLSASLACAQTSPLKYTPATGALVPTLNATQKTGMATSLGLLIGTNVQAYDTDLTTWAGVTPGTGVATALGNATNGTGGLISYSGNIGIASGLQLSLTGTGGTGGVPALGLTGAWQTSTAGGMAQLMINQGGTAPTTLSTSGTGFSINASGTTADFLNCLAADTSKFKVDGTGAITGLGITIGNGAATATISSNLSGATDPTITFGNALVTSSHGITVSAGVVTLPAGTQTAPSLTLGTANCGLYRQGTNNIAFVSNNSDVCFVTQGEVDLVSNCVIQWGNQSNTFVSNSGDTAIRRLAAGVFGVPGFGGTPQALSGAGAVNLTSLTTALTTAGTGDAITLANGTNGQIKTIVLDVLTSGGHTSVLTPTTKTGFSSCTFTAAGNTLVLQYFTTRGWMIMSSYGTTVTP